MFHIFYIDRLFSLLKKVCLQCSKKRTPGKQCLACNTPYDALKKYTHTIMKKEGEVVLSPAQVRAIVSNVPNDDCASYGFHATHARPEWCIITVLPIVPPSVRPSARMSAQRYSCDDLTYKYSEIIKLNNTLRSLSGAPPHILHDFSKQLQWHLTTLFDSSQAIYESRTRKHVECKAFKQRLQGKEGRIRYNLMGKRVNFCGRTVITPDPNLELDEVGMPVSMAAKLTVPVSVTSWNKPQMEKMLSKALYLVRKDGTRYDLSVFRCRNLFVGDVLERPLVNGDIVVLNRQPSLHKMSMMGHRVRILSKGKTMRLNLSVTTPYNADFDGDEMNVHVPQSYGAIAEVKGLMMVPKCILAAQNNRPCMGIVQDSLLASHLMTRSSTWIGRAEVMSILYHAFSDIHAIPVPAICHPVALWSGKQIFSTLFPPELDIDAFGVLVDHGELLFGTLNKKSLGLSNGSIIHRLFRIDEQQCTVFYHRLQRMVDHWMLSQGFSTGLGDCLNRVGSDIDAILSEYPDPFTCSESEMNQQLNALRDHVGRCINADLTSTNGMKCMVDSGSKGSLVNISQIQGCVGQQNVWGQRIPIQFRDRSLPHFSRHDNSAQARGFIQHSYVQGLNPSEFFFHAMAGRVGLIDTACKTAQTGYTERKLMKSLENVHIAYDHTVRNSQGGIIQFKYGDDDLDGARLIEVPLQDERTVVWSMEEKMRYSLPEWALIEQEAIYFLEGGGPYPPCPMPFDLEQLIRRTLRLFPSSTGQHLVSVQEAASWCPRNLSPKLQWYLRWVGSTRKCIFEYALTTHALKYLQQEVQRLLTKARISPSEMVGALAAHSLAEPATQLTLNTFHFTGIGNKTNISLGVPRLLELLNCSRHPKQPSMILHGDHAACKAVTGRTLSSMMDTKCMYVFGRVPEEDALWWSLHQQLYGQFPLQGRWAMVFYLTKTVTQEWVQSVCVKHDHQVYGAASPFPTPRVLFFVELSGLHDKPLSALRDIQRILDDELVEGVRNISAVHYDEEHDHYSTTGTNLRQLFCSTYPSHLDLHRCTSNSLFDVFHTLGIEAARATLLQEIRRVLSFNGSYVNVRHLSLLVDSMTFRGILCSVTRHGFHKYDTSVLKKCTFESSMDALIQGALTGKLDRCTGVSENLILGRLMPGGSGAVVQLLDEDKCLFGHVPRAPSPPSPEATPFSNAHVEDTPTGAFAPPGYVPGAFAPPGFVPGDYAPPGFVPGDYAPPGCLQGEGVPFDVLPQDVRTPSPGSTPPPYDFDGECTGPSRSSSPSSFPPSPSQAYGSSSPTQASFSPIPSPIPSPVSFSPIQSRSTREGRKRKRYTVFEAVPVVNTVSTSTVQTVVEPHVQTQRYILMKHRQNGPRASSNKGGYQFVPR
jgi:DNA-directed RNA polymerase II subunit RPB1